MVGKGVVVASSTRMMTIAPAEPLGEVPCCPWQQGVAMKPSPTKNPRGGKSTVQDDLAGKPDCDLAERALEQGLEESFPGSDPVSITQPTHRTGKNKKADT